MPSLEELLNKPQTPLMQDLQASGGLEQNNFTQIPLKKAYEYGYDPSNTEDQHDAFARAYQENSSWTERWGNRGKALAAGTVLEAFGGLTALAYGAGAYGASILSGNADFTKAFDNDFSRMLNNSRESLAEATKNYYTKEQQESLAGWVTSGKFVDDLTGGASFLLGAALTEAVAGLLTAGTGGAAAPMLAGNTARIAMRAASLLKKADKAGDFTRLISYADDAVSVTKNLGNFRKVTEAGKFGRQLMTGAGYEASVEALGAKKEYEAKIDAQLSRGEITPEKAIELKQRADEAATASFFTNLALVGVSNMVQFTSLFRPDLLTTMSKVPSRYKIAADGINNVDSVYNKFRRGSRYVTNVGGESLEEFSQTVINKTGESYVFNKYDTENNAGVLQTMDNFVKHAAEGVQNSLNQEGLQSAILGGVMGAVGIPTFGLTRGADGKRQWLSGGIAEAKNENFEEVRRVNELQQKFDSNTKQGAIQFIAETMGSENTKANWVNGVQQHAATQAEEIALQTGNVMAAKNAEHDRLFSFVQNRQQVGQSSDIQDMLNSVKEMSPEQFGEQFGYENLSKEELAKRKDETVKKAKERIDNINGALKQIESAFPQMSEDWKTAAAYNLSKAKDVKTRLDDISEKLVNELQVTSMFDEQAKSAQSRKESLQADYDSKTSALTAERNVVLDKIKSEPTDKTDKLVNKRNQLSDQIDALTETLNQDLRGIDAALDQVKKSSQIISKKGKSINDLDNLFLKNTEAINQAIEQIAQDDPAKASQLAKDFKDFKTLRDTHKRVIDEYNRLLTPQGTQAFEAKVETAKKEGTPEVAKQPEAENQNGEVLNQQDGAVNDALVGPSNVADDLDLAIDSTLVDPESIEAKKADIERRRQEELNAVKLNTSLSEFELENTPDLKTGSTSKRFKIKKDGKEVGVVSLNIDENGNVRIAYMEINPSNRRKGLAENFYKDLNKALQKNKQGVLYSDKVFLDELSEWERMKKRGELRKWVLDGKELSKDEIDALKKDINKVIELQDSGRLITEEAEDLQEVLPAQKMWEKLVEKGFAEKLEDGTYRFKYDAELSALADKPVVKESTEKEKINFIKKDYQRMSPKINVAQGTIEIKRTGGNFDAAVKGLKERLLKDFGKNFVVTIIEPKVESNPEVVPAIATEQPVGEIPNELVVKDGFVYKENADLYIQYTNLDEIDPTQYKIVTKTYDNNPSSTFGLEKGQPTYELYYTLPSGLDVYVGYIEDSRYDRINGKVVTDETVRLWAETVHPTNVEYHIQRWKVKKELTPKLKSLSFKTSKAQFHDLKDPKNYLELENYKFEGKTIVMLDGAYYEIKDGSAKIIKSAAEKEKYRKAIDERNISNGAKLAGEKDDKILGSILAEGDAVILTDKFILPAKRREAKNPNAAKEAQDIILAVKDDSQGFIINNKKEADSLNEQIKLKIMLSEEVKAYVKFDERREVPGRYNLQFIAGEKKAFFKYDAIKSQGLAKLIEDQCATWGIKLIGIDNYPDNKPETTFTPNNWRGSKRIYRKVVLTTDQPVAVNTPAIENIPVEQVVEKQVEQTPAKVVTTDSKVDILKDVIESGKPVQDMIKDLEAKGLSNDTKGAFIQAADDASLLDYFDTVEDLVAALKKYTGKAVKSQEPATTLKPEIAEILRSAAETKPFKAVQDNFDDRGMVVRKYLSKKANDFRAATLAKLKLLSNVGYGRFVFGKGDMFTYPSKEEALRNIEDTYKKDLQKLEEYIQRRALDEGLTKEEFISKYSEEENIKKAEKYYSLSGGQRRTYFKDMFYNVYTEFRFLGMTNTESDTAVVYVYQELDKAIENFEPKLLRKIEGKFSDKYEESSFEEYEAQQSKVKSIVDEYNNYITTVEDVAKPKVRNQSNPILSRGEAIENISAIIPSELISDEELNIAARNIQAVGDIEGLYDKFIYLARVITPGTEYHEAFHAVFNALISPVEKQNLMQQWLMVNPKPSKATLNRFRNSYSGYSTLSEAELLDEYIEESLADEFAKYMDKNAKPKALLGRIFDRIKRWLGLNSKIDQFFDLIKRGAFKSKPRYDEVNKVRVAKPNVLYADANKQNPLETRTGHVVITRIAQRILSGEYSGKGISNDAKVEMAIKDVVDYYKSTYIDDVAVRKSLSQDTINSVKSIIRALRNPENKEIMAQELELIKSLYAADEDEDNEIEDLENRNSDEGIVTKPVNQQDGFSKENIWKLWTVNTFYTDREFDGGPMVELPIDYYATQIHIKMLAKNYPKDRLWDVVQTFALNPNEVELKALLKRLEATVRKELGDYKGDLTHAKMSDSFMYNAFILSNYKTDVEMFDLFWNPKTSDYEIGSANNSSIKRTTVNKWINNLATKTFTKDELVKAFEGIDVMLSSTSTTLVDIASALNRVGIDVSYDYIKYNMYALEIQTPQGEDKQWFDAIYSDEIPLLTELIRPSDAPTEKITNRIKALDIPTNIYADISGWLEKVAIGDSLFNTAVRKSTFKNIDGKTIYEIIYNSAESERMRAISNPKYKELVAQIKKNLKADPTSLRKETLKFMEFMDIPYQEHLTYQEVVQWIADNPLVELLSKVEPKFIGGYKDNHDNRTMFSEGDAKVKTNMLLSFATRGKKRKDTINFHLLNVKAGKTLQTIYGVPDQGFGVTASKDQILGLNDKTKDVLLDFFKQEFNRIQRAAAFDNSPRVATSPDFGKAYEEEIKAYTDSKRKRGGLAFMQHADFIKEVIENPSYKSHKAFVNDKVAVKDEKGKINYIYEALPTDDKFYEAIKQDLETYWVNRANQFIQDIAEEHKINRNKIETADAYITDAIVSRGLYQLLAYDPALTVKDAIDQNKRAGSDGAAGPSSSGRIRFATVESAEIHLGSKPGEKDSEGKDKIPDADANQYDTVKAKIAELLKSGKMSKDVAKKSLEKLEELSQSKTDTSDATSFMTTEAYIEHYLKPFLKYDSEVAAIYKKIAAGIMLTKDDTSIIDKKNAHANPRKLVYSNGVDYFKTATNVLTRYEFSIAKNDDPEFLMAEYDKFLEAKKEYMSVLEDLERQLAYEEINLETFDTLRLEAFSKYEPIVKAYHSNFIAIPGSEVGHATLNRMQLYGFDMMGVDSSSKKQKRKVGKLDSFNYHNTQVLDASYLREQVATDGVKIHVIDGTQKLSLIWSEQGTVEVLVDGVKVRIDNLSKAMQVQLGKRIVQGFQDLMPKIEKEGLAYYDYLKESLIASQQASGGNNYFIEFLQDDYNWNLPHIVGKVEASFFSATSKNTLKHKTDGTAVALLPGTMYNVLRDENDNVVTRNYVRKHWRDILNDDGTIKKAGWKVTRLRHLVWDESLGVFVSEVILPEIHPNIRTTREKGKVLDVFKYMVGIRIPTQDKQSMLAMKLVDTLPAYKGSLGIMPAESVKLSGEDFDIDKKFINYFSTFKYEGRDITKYGEYLRTGSIEDAWVEFKNSSAGMDYISKLLEGNVSQKELDRQEAKIALIEEKLAEYPEDFDLKNDLMLAKDTLRDLEMRANSVAIKDMAKADFLIKKKVQIQDNIAAFKQGKFSLINAITLEENNNLLLEMQLRMISNPDNLHIALTPAEMTPVEEAIKVLTKYTDPKYANATADELKDYVKNQDYVYVKGNHALDDKLKAFNNNDVGSKNIGIFALANTFYQYVMAEKIEPFYSTNFEIPNLGRINDILSAFLSSSTDNDKVQHAAVLGLDQKSSGILAVGVMMGYHPGEIMIPMLNAEKIGKNIRTKLDDIDKTILSIVEDNLTPEGLAIGASQDSDISAILKVIEQFKSSGFVKSSDGTKIESEVIYRLLTNKKTSLATQLAMYEIFKDVEKVGKSVSKVQRIMSLNKGFKPTIYDNLRVLQAVRDLKRLKDTGKEPFAAYDLVTTHPYLKANVQAARVFLGQGGVVSKFFLMATDKIRSGFEIVDTMPNEAAKDAMVKSIGIEVMNSILNSDEEFAKLSTDLILNEKGDFTLTAHNLLKASKFGKMYMMKVLVPNRVTTDSGETYATMNLDTWAVSNKFTEEKLQSNFTFANGKPRKTELKDIRLYTEKLSDLMKRFKSIDSIANLEQRGNVLKQIIKEFEDVTVFSLELKDGKLVTVADILLNDYSRKLQAQAIVKDVMQFRNGSVVKLLNPRSWKKISSLFDTQQKAIVKNEPTAFDGNFVEKALIHYAMSYENFTMIPTIEEYTDNATNYSDYTVTVEDVNKVIVPDAIDFQEELNGVSMGEMYRNRTIRNASADATIAIAIDWNTAGEKLTKTSVLKQNKKYIPIDASSLAITPERVDKIVQMLNSVNAKTLNIAGNGIYTMKGKYTQEQVDDFTYDLMNQVLNSPKLTTKIVSIRSGGQTGFDEAGAKAGVKLGLPTIVLAPKGWTFRNINSQDISNESQFKSRFGATSSSGSSTNKIVVKFEFKDKKPIDAVPLQFVFRDGKGIKWIADEVTMHGQTYKSFDEVFKAVQEVGNEIQSVTYKPIDSDRMYWGNSEVLPHRHDKSISIISTTKKGKAEKSGVDNQVNEGQVPFDDLTQDEYVAAPAIEGKIYTYQDFANDNKGVEVLVQYEKYKAPFKAIITGQVEEVMSGTDENGSYKHVGVQVRSTTGKLLVVNPFFEITGNIRNRDKLVAESNLIRESKSVAQGRFTVKYPKEIVFEGFIFQTSKILAVREVFSNADDGDVSDQRKFDHSDLKEYGMTDKQYQYAVKNQSLLHSLLEAADRSDTPIGNTFDEIVDNILKNNATLVDNAQLDIFEVKSVAQQIIDKVKSAPAGAYEMMDDIWEAINSMKDAASKRSALILLNMEQGFFETTEEQSIPELMPKDFTKAQLGEFLKQYCK